MAGEKGAIRAKDADIHYYTVCGLTTALGLIVIVFMIILCFKGANRTSADMLMMLNAIEIALILLILFAYGRMQKICRKNLGFSRAAVERRGDGSARVEFAAGTKHYYLEIPREEKIAESGMLNVWYDPDDPRNVFLEKKLEKPSAFGPASIGSLIVLGGIVNFVFFVILL